MKRTATAVWMLFLLILPLSLKTTEQVLEPWTYSENFEERLLGAWASYPHWQDTAYDPNIRPNTMVPGDPNVSLEERVTPYTHVDNYCGAQKLLDMYVVPGSSIRLRYYLKSHLPFEFLKVRLAAGPEGKVDTTFPSPKTNGWEWITVTYDDFVRENPRLAGKGRIKVNALAVLAKVPKADPAMPFYFGLDDVTFQGARTAVFKFEEPKVEKLPDYRPYIPLRHYFKGDQLTLKGSWIKTASRVEIDVVSFTERDTRVFSGELKKQGNTWALGPMPVRWKEGLYLATLKAMGGDKRPSAVLSETEFTIHVAPKGMGGKHPRLWWDRADKSVIENKLKSEKYASVLKGIASQAVSLRQKSTVESLGYDLDQYPDENWLATWAESGAKLMGTGEPIQANALAYAFQNDREAGAYVKDILLKLADYPTWHHPWQIKRGRFADHRTGAWSHRLAIGYDLAYDLMTEAERAKIRKAFMEQLVQGAYRSHVWDNNVTSNTSNWIAMIAGGSLMLQAAMFGDGPDVENLEPYFTGTALKLYDFLESVTNWDDAWGESYGYNNYSFTNLGRSLAALERVFNIDFHKPVATSYKEYIWAGLIKDRRYFYWGDSSGGSRLRSGNNWLWLLAKTKDPLLAWFCNHLKQGETWEDVLYADAAIPMKDPFSESPNRLFRSVGTTVFKGGWEPTDFSFAMRSGSFFNHQHLDQGAFWLADRGTIFLEERSGSDYYDDYLYQPWFTQPVAHSTILINGNHQSQRTGDIINFAEGFDDHAKTIHFLDGQFSAFSTGDLTPLYWDAVKGLERNVLFIKPRTVILLDTVTPVRSGTGMTMLFQAGRLKDLVPGEKASTLTVDGKVLHFVHLAPEAREVKAVETPHYLNTLKDPGILQKEGMLTVTVKTDLKPLVAANLLTTTTGGAPEVSCSAIEGGLTGRTAGLDFAFSTRPGFIYTAGDISTDAVAVTWKGGGVFAARCTRLSKGGKVLVQSAQPLTCEVSGGTVKYYHCVDDEVSIGMSAKPSSVIVNGVAAKFIHDAAGGLIKVALPKGEGAVIIK